MRSAIGPLAVTTSIQLSAVLTFLAVPVLAPAMAADREHIFLIRDHLIAPGCVLGRRGAQRDVGHRTSVATHPKRTQGPPSAGSFCAVAALRSLTDAPHRRRNRSAATAQNNPGQMVPY